MPIRASIRFTVAFTFSTSRCVADASQSSMRTRRSTPPATAAPPCNRLLSDMVLLPVKQLIVPIQPRLMAIQALLMAHQPFIAVAQIAVDLALPYLDLL